MADVAITAAQVQATPGGYTISGGQEIIPKSIEVSFDGTGAGGSFVPVLQLVAPGETRTIVSEYPLVQTLAAGASADITWFPGVTPQVAAPSGGVTPGVEYDGVSWAGVAWATLSSLEFECFGWWQGEGAGSQFSQITGNFGIVFDHGTGTNQLSVYPTDALSNGPSLPAPFKVGTGVIQLASASQDPPWTTYEFDLIASNFSDKLLAWCPDGTPVTRLNPVALSTGDIIHGYWVTFQTNF